MPLVRFKLEKILAFVKHLARDHLVRRMPGEHFRQSRFPRPVRPHDRVDLALVDLKIQALQNFLAVDTGMQIFYFK